MLCTTNPPRRCRAAHYAGRICHNYYGVIIIKQPYVDPPTSLTTASASYGPGFVSVFLLAIMVMVASYATSRMRYAEYTQLGLINTKPTQQGPMLPLRTK